MNLQNSQDAFARRCSGRRAAGWVLACGLALGAAQGVAAEQTAEQQIEALYGADLKKVKLTAATGDDLALAQKLVGDGVSASQNKPFQAALLRRAFLLALEDPTAEGAAAAQKAVQGLIAAQIVAAPAGWQELTDKVAVLLRRRNLGAKDPQYPFYLRWLRWQAEAAQAAGDQQLAERTLNALVREAQYQHSKYEADEAQQMLARGRFEAPFRAAVKRDWSKWQEKPEDPELAQKAGEVALAQMGDWAAAAEPLAKLTTTDWPFILQWRQARLAPPAAKPKEGDHHDDGKPAGTVAAAAKPSAAQLLSAADTLNALATPNRSSVLGRAAVLTEAATLVAAAQQADQGGLTTQQKIELAARATQADGAAGKAEAELEAAFSRASRVIWTPLISNNRAADWSDLGQGTVWTVLENNVLQGKGSWDSVTRSLKAPKLGDFILEGEYQRKTEDAHPFFLLREHTWTPCYALEISSGRVKLIFEKGGDNGEREIESKDWESPQDQWVKLRVVWEGDQYRIWINEQLICEGHDEAELTAGGLCLGAANGMVWYRNLRVRELP